MNGTLTDVLGIEVGHYTDAAHRTGCTVVGVVPDLDAEDVRRAHPRHRTERR